MKVQKPTNSRLMAAILLFLFGLIEMILYFTYFHDNKCTLIFCIGILILCTGLLKGSDSISLAGCSITVIPEVIWVIQDLNYWSYENGDFVSYVVGDTADLMAFVVLLVLIILHLSSAKTGIRNGADKVWFLPGVINAVGYAIVFIHSWIPILSVADSSAKMSIVYNVIEIAGIFFAGKGICDQDPLVGIQSEQNNA